MAKFKPILGELSGSVAGNTFSNNKGGAYLRQRTAPTNPNSTKQQAARGILATVSAAWAALSAANKATWSVWAALHAYPDSLGTMVHLSAQQAFCKANCNRVAAGMSIISTAPLTDVPDALTTATVTLTAPQGLSVAFTPALAAGDRLVVWQTEPGSAGRDPNMKQARLQGISAAAASSPWTGTSQFSAQVGQVSNFYVGVQSTYGLRGVAIKDAATAA